ncbi:MAG: hypothetical protein JJU08_06720 [Rhodobacteraceae bacterium]|nr:hypothetical protein [Paracoccaceae bacterium]
MTARPSGQIASTGARAAPVDVAVHCTAEILAPALAARLRFGTPDGPAMA